MAWSSSLAWRVCGRADQPHSLRMSWPSSSWVGGCAGGLVVSPIRCACRGPPPPGLVGVRVGWWSAPFAAHTWSSSWVGGCAGRVGGQPHSLRMAGSSSWVGGCAGWVGGQPHSLRMAWSSSWVGGRRGGSVVSPIRCAWRAPPPGLVGVGVGRWSAPFAAHGGLLPSPSFASSGRIVTCGTEPATLTAGLALCDHVTSITYRP